ncbi:1,4-dihydroxy-2-naphthoate octaprenyltransferase [Pseudoprevotella muciniphila]|uniref:1,4-dihydroxy-2-naphthoate octaprenyltransferase n=1 Tax=Pseudoprevotella muciniphila TaxID=2133944 RepID=A0A5P8E698_9BACT|nr:1,4-dihydroxy-2-naphthoate octaprenyltransferase [Pseudoprevotella muciniphila]QFQ12569.1 1,4-dihydroxy-2-naphthoate octaprenyltransferase [Pseudoprevotella muciniphila]
MNTVRKNSLMAWFLASRPKTLSGAVLPVALGIALAYTDGVGKMLPAVLCVLFALVMQVAANFINDLFDFLKGTDGEDRLGPERACAQGWITPSAMKIGIALTIVLAGGIGLALLWQTFLSRCSEAWWLVGLGVACIVFAFLYTTLLSYCGMGDVLVWVFFGFVPVCGTYYVQAGNICSHALWLSAAVGLVVDTLLVLNNYRDRDTDRMSGKHTLISVLGERFGRYYYLAVGMLGVVCLVPVAVDGAWGVMIGALYLLPHITTWRTMTRIFSGKALNKVLALTSRNMMIFGILVVVGLILSQIGH